MPIGDTSQAEQGDDSGGSHEEGGIPTVMDRLAENPFDNEASKHMHQQASSVLDSTNEGGWAISEEGAKMYIKVCDTFLDQYDDMIGKAQQLTKRVKLGSSPYAYAVAEFNTKVADGDKNSLIPNLKLMKDGFEKLKEALQVARNNYNEQEESVVQHLGKLVPPDEAN